MFYKNSWAQRTWRGTLCCHLRAAVLDQSAVMSTSVQEIVVILEKVTVLKDKWVTLLPHPDNKGI